MSDFIGFTCTTCGSEKFVLPNQPPKDDDVISCAGCKREIGIYAVIRDALVARGKAEIDQALSKAFGKDIKLEWTKR